MYLWGKIYTVNTKCFMVSIKSNPHLTFFTLCSSVVVALSSEIVSLGNRAGYVWANIAHYEKTLRNNLVGRMALLFRNLQHLWLCEIRS
jgi:hypothetical protein